MNPSAGAGRVHPSLGELLDRYRRRSEAALEACLPAADSPPATLHQAMRYSVLGGGKRVRPVLVYATGEALGAAIDHLDTAACAVELIHAYSLIHDDLPAMDDDDLRRGRPTCHRRFDEATAILAGDALQALACEILARDPAAHADPAARLRMIDRLSAASGSLGMAGGQAMDLQAVGRQISLESLETMHRHKTGALIEASVELGALSAGPVEDTTLDCLRRYADAIGLAFQIVDDILDETADTEVLGKTQGADRALNKPTYPALLGLDGACRHAQDMHAQALAALAGLDRRFDVLRSLSAYIVERSR